MKPSITDLWRWDGPLDRGTYAFWGILLAGLKYNIDRLIAASFGREWRPFSYLKPGLPGEDITHLVPATGLFYAILVAVALPFLWAGTVLTVRRLRTLELPPWLVVFFFLPVANLFFFLVLTLVPDRAPQLDAPQGPFRAWLDALVPESRIGSATLAVLVTGLLGVGLTLVAVNAAGEYGWGLFVGLPFLLGLNAALIHGWHAPRSLTSCLLAGAAAVGVLAAGLLAFAIEGIICLAMAAPIGLVLALLGATLGWTIQNCRIAPRTLPPAMVLLIVVLPLLMAAEARDTAPAPLIAVVTTVEVDAPPERVWEHVVAFSDLPPPESWIFELGVAYPVRARIDGRGVGAIRHCEFSTGPFVEPITAWEQPSRLAFDVIAQPRPMKELSPYTGIEAPHLDGFLRSERGQFLLTPLPGGRTKLEGTTWYRHRIWPSPYWQVWSDAIIHAIHERVLAHVKRLSEQP